ncbi:MFS transporter [Paenarthrobacter sp. NPDC090520]|uniref:MFS transporter n=1 Tax=Paenarthrobacter sp. NPDC090520 TaxID=3364382 RepID=UPI0038193A62
MTTMTPQLDAKTRQLKLQSLRSALIGNGLEYFDWTAYAVFSPFIAGALFASSDPTSSLLLTLAVFAVSFIIRPIGGWIFGRMADKRGRKDALVASMILMGVGSLLLALIPPYASIGITASVLLLVVRLIQGLAYGGESSAAYVYVSELAPASRRGLWSSTIFMTVTLGAIAGSVFGFGLTALLPVDAMAAWGWRVPFIVGALLSIYALWLRRRSVETEVGSTLSAAEDSTAGDPASEALAGSAKRVLVLRLLRLFFILGATNVAFYTWLSFASTYAISTLGMDKQGAFAASLGAQVLSVALFPFFGWLSDRVGRKPVAIFATAGFAAITFPLSAFLNVNPWTLFTAQLIALVFWTAVGSVWPAVLAEGVTPRERAVGLGITTSLAAGIFGGTAPYLNTWLTSMGSGWMFSTYVVVIMVIATGLLFTMRETRGIDLATMERPASDSSDLRQEKTVV